MGASLLADAAAVFLLLGAANLGAAMSAALIVMYTWAAMPLHLGGEPADCRCFFMVLNTRTKSGLVVRNCWLLLTAFAVLVGRPTASWMGVALGGAILAWTGLLAALTDRIKGIPDQAFAEDRHWRATGLSR
jgi:hypothetical protein